MKTRARVIGVHPLPSEVPLHLVEVEVEGIPDFDFGKVTQEVTGQAQNDWQGAYDEREVGDNRFVFFFHHLDPAKPLLSSVGPLALPAETPVPEHLRDIEYEQP